MQVVSIDLFAMRGSKIAVGIWLEFDRGTQNHYDATRGTVELESDPHKRMIVRSASPAERSPATAMGALTVGPF